MPGLIFDTSSYPRPILSRAPGRKFSVNTSAVLTSRRANSKPARCFRLMAMPSLPRFILAKYTLLSFTIGPMWRASSPPGGSTLITLAPRSPKIIVQNGPANTLVKSMTVKPSKSLAI